MKELTRAEEQIMQVLWSIEKGFVNDILSQLPEPRPAYNTVSTIVRILEQKGFVGHTAFGRTHEYFPLVQKKAYSHVFFRNFMSNYFGNSYKSLASFFTREENLSLEELEAIRRMIDKEIEKKLPDHE
ncbi:MAG: BlaI/MecI/CopY family transcriptional regulator [Bacteroidales bacterium]|jgi:predicted transcriptional regulator|nr:BlaI/MecI/CopY family transcriptional regulator [Bacteroidales bacterium]